MENKTIYVGNGTIYVGNGTIYVGTQTRKPALQAAALAVEKS